MKPPVHTADWKVVLPNLQVLDLTLRLPPFRLQESYGRVLNLPGLFERAPNITKLRLYGFKSIYPSPDMDFSMLKSLASLELCRTYINTPPLLPNSLKELTMNDIISSALRVENWCFRSPLPLLERLHLDAQAFAFSAVVQLLLGTHLNGNRLSKPEPVRALKSFGLYGASPEKPIMGVQENVQGLFDLFSHLESNMVEELTLSYFNDASCRVDDKVTRAISKVGHFSSVKHINLTGTAITGVGIKELVKNMRPCLQTLVVSDCMDISSDAIEWAKQQKVVVIDKPSKSGANTGRRVFYG